MKAVTLNNLNAGDKESHALGSFLSWVENQEMRRWNLPIWACNEEREQFIHNMIS